MGHGTVVRDNAFCILSTVVRGIVDWAQRQQPAYLYWFVGDARHQRLFGRMVRCLDVDPFTGRRCVPEVFWLGRNLPGATEPAR